MKLQPDVELYNGPLNTNLGSGLLGPLDVSGYESVMIAFWSDNVNATTLQCNWGAEDALDPSGGLVERITSSPPLVNTSNTPLVAIMRNLGPFLRVNWSTLALNRRAAIWLTNRHHVGDGPVTPGAAGRRLYTKQRAGGASGTDALDLYTGPAQVSIRLTGSGAGFLGWCDVRDAVTGVTVASTGIVGPAFALVQEIWIPPQPCTIFSGCAGAGVDVAIVAAS